MLFRRGEAMKFLVDRNLGKLAGWLRTLGYDAALDRGEIDRTLLDRGYREGRTVLTKRKDMALRNFRGRLHVVGPDDLPGQLREVCRVFGLEPDRSLFFTRCLLCNEVLLNLAPEKAASFVPPYVSQTQDTFHRCPACGRIYWAGTHRDHILEYLGRILEPAGDPGKA